MERGPPDIRERTFAFAVRVVRLVNALPRTTAGRVFAAQLMRAGTSVGANVEEAQGAHSRKDFARRLNIARTEAREVLFWLRLMCKSRTVVPKLIDDLIREADEIVRILVAIVKRTKEGKLPETR